MTRVLRGGTAVVTGGAGTAAGLGQGLVRNLSAQGMRVAIVDVDVDAAAALADELRAGGADSLACGVDVRDVDQLRAAAAEIRRAFGGCNLLCAHVGAGMPGRVDELDPDAWRDALDTTLIGTVSTVQAFLPVLRSTHGLRHIVLTSSVAALAPGRFQGPYRAAKAAVTSFGETLERELRAEGIGTTIAFPSGMAPSAVLESVAADRPMDELVAGLPPAFREVASALREEFAADPADLTTGHAAAAAIIDAVVADERYVITHGASFEQPYRERLAHLEDAVARLHRRRGATGDDSGRSSRAGT